MPKFRVRNQLICQSLKIMIVPNWRNSKNPNSVKRPKQRRYVFNITIIHIFSHDLLNSRKCNDKIHKRTNKTSMKICQCSFAYMHFRRQVFSTCFPFLTFYISFNCARSFCSLLSECLVNITR